jgi:hypothetical protein
MLDAIFRDKACEWSIERYPVERSFHGFWYGLE